jgi:hypothetical protein
MGLKKKPHRVIIAKTRGLSRMLKKGEMGRRKTSRKIEQISCQDGERPLSKLYPRSFSAGLERGIEITAWEGKNNPPVSRGAGERARGG